MSATTKRPVVRIEQHGAGFRAVCYTSGCVWTSHLHAVKAGAVEEARWHRDHHRRNP